MVALNIQAMEVGSAALDDVGLEQIGVGRGRGFGGLWLWDCSKSCGAEGEADGEEVEELHVDIFLVDW